MIVVEVLEYFPLDYLVFLSAAGFKEPLADVGYLLVTDVLAALCVIRERE